MDRVHISSDDGGDGVYSVSSSVLDTRSWTSTFYNASKTRVVLAPACWDEEE